MGEEPESPSPDKPTFLCIEYPGMVKNVPAMLDTLGGLTNIARVYSESSRRLELRFRPDDIFCKPTCGERTTEAAFLLSVKRMKRKRPDGSYEYKLKTNILGYVDCTFKFSNLCDFQYLPVERTPEGGYRSIYREVFPDSLVNSSWVEEPAPLFLPPAAFSRMDLPQDYQYRREAAGEKTSMLTHYNVIGRTRQRRSHHAIFVTFDVDKVPDRPRDIAVSQLKVKFIAKSDLEEVKRRFLDEAPVWSKNALSAVTAILPERLKFILPTVAYYFTTGPWRNQWVRFAYDPRKEADAAQYQTLDYRVRLQGGARRRVKAKRSYANYLLPYKAMNWSKPRTSVIDTEAFSNITSKETTPPSLPEETAAATKEEDDAKKDLYIFRPGRFPPSRQMFYQFKDLHLTEAQELIASSRGPPGTSCDEKNGWFVAGTDAKLREILTKAVNDHLSKENLSLEEVPSVVQGDNDDLADSPDTDSEEDEILP